jgi:hypothetical protein
MVHHDRLSKPWQSVGFVYHLACTTVLKTLALQCMDWVIHWVAQGPHILCYDNININTSIFVEQCSSKPARVQLWIFPVLYEV